MTAREKWALRELLDFKIHRYLMTNSCQRLDSSEKASLHIEISEVLCQFIYCCDESDSRLLGNWRIVHDYLAEILTDHLDTAIGFPVTTPLYGEDYYPLADKFFNVILKNFKNIEKMIKQI